MEALKQKFIIKETVNNEKDKLQRLKLFKVTKKVLQFLDIMQKHQQVLENTEEILNGYHLTFPHLDAMLEVPCTLKLNDIEYYAQRAKDWKITFV